METMLPKKTGRRKGIVWHDLFVSLIPQLKVFMLLDSFFEMLLFLAVRLAIFGAAFYALNDSFEFGFGNPYFLVFSGTLVAFSVALVYRPIQGLSRFFVGGSPLSAIAFTPLSYLLVVPFAAIIIFGALLASVRIELYTLDVIVALLYLLARGK